MEIHEVYGSWFVNHILPSSTLAITLYPFILYRANPPLRETRRHEWTHISQVRTTGWIKFYFNYLVQLIKVGYWKITWEVEAYAEQDQVAWPANCPDHPNV